MSFDPWTAIEMEAVIAFQEIHPNGPPPWNGSYQGDIMQQWYGAQLVKAARPSVEAGNGAALMACMREIVRSGLVAPDWLARAFNGRYEAVEHFEYMSWDDAFDKPHPPKTNQRKQRKALLYPLSIRLAIYHELETTNLSLTKIVEKLAPVFCISVSEVWMHYRASNKRFGELSSVGGNKRRYNRR